MIGRTNDNRITLLYTVWFNEHRRKENDMDRPMKISEIPAGCNPMDFEDEDDLTEYDTIPPEAQRPWSQPPLFQTNKLSDGTEVPK